MKLELLNTVIDYPFVYQNSFFDGALLRQNKTCVTKCKSKDCTSLINHQNSTQYVCSRNFNNYLLVTNEFKIILNGLIDKSNSKILIAQKEARKEYLVDDADIQHLYKRLKSIVKLITDSITNDLEKNFGVLHDVKTSLGIVQYIAEAIVAKQPGATFTEKLTNCDQNIHDLFDAVSFVNNQLSMIDVVVNPSSISQGQKRGVNLFKLFHKVSKLFVYKAKQKNIDIKWANTHEIGVISAYESIEFIPLILLDNAVKYSERGSNISILFSLTNTKLIIEVSSYGKVVPVSDRRKIFEKYGRAVNANSSGIGLGLWLAQQIVAQNGGRLSYSAKNEDPLTWNTFTVELNS